MIPAKMALRIDVDVCIRFEGNVESQAQIIL